MTYGFEQDADFRATEVQQTTSQIAFGLTGQMGKRI